MGPLAVAAVPRRKLATRSNYLARLRVRVRVYSVAIRRTTYCEPGLAISQCTSGRGGNFIVLCPSYSMAV